MERLLEVLTDLIKKRKPCVLATVVSGSGSVPGKPGARMVVWDEGQHGTVGGGSIEYRVVEEARARLQGGLRAPEIRSYDLARDLGMVCGGAMEVFFERLDRPSRLVIFGAGHIGRSLALMGAEAGFEVTVIDERPEVATAERFPSAQQVHAMDPASFFSTFESDPDTYFLVATHQHQRDEEVVRRILALPSAFTGVVGSRSKRATFEKNLQNAGFSNEQIARVHMPVGIPLGSNSPADIAVSILAQLIRVRSQAEVQPGTAQGGGN